MDYLLVYSANALALTVLYHPHFDSIEYPLFLHMSPLCSFIYTAAVTLQLPQICAHLHIY